MQAAGNGRWRAHSCRKLLKIGDILRTNRSDANGSGLQVGGGGGIRTRDTVSRIHTFQACAFDRSATPPTRSTQKRARAIAPAAARAQAAPLLRPSTRRREASAEGRFGVVCTDFRLRPNARSKPKAFIALVMRRAGRRFGVGFEFGDKLPDIAAAVRT
jgi:hypothetical protein